MIDLNKYLMDNGYNHERETADKWNYIDYYSKKFSGYFIRITNYTNYYGGHEKLEVYTDWKNLPPPKKEVYTMKTPAVIFDTTGYDDYAALEKMIAEDIVPHIRKWAIEGL